MGRREFSRVAALFGMLNSCAAGVTVVDIDNGFGAAVIEGLISQLRFWRLAPRLGRVLGLRLW